MHKKSLNIGTQLQIGFAILLALVVLLGVVSYVQTKKLQLQTNTIFNHPFQVSKAVAAIEIEIQHMVVASRELTIATSEKDRIRAKQKLEAATEAATRQFSIVDAKYLGEQVNVDNALKAFSNWKIVLNEQAEKAKNNAENVYREELISILDIIDAFATNKATQTFVNSQKLGKDLNLQLILLVIIILIISTIVNYILLRNIQKPLRILTDTTHRFRHGDLNARSSYRVNNEFGMLSDSFNKLAYRIQQDVELSDKKASLAASMLSENDTRLFFQSTLTTLLKLTDSQMAAIYLVSEDQKSLDLYESIGLNDHLHKSFDIGRFEGEIGPVFSTRKVQHIKALKDDEPFVFETVCGSIKPREIITMPLLSGDRIIATIHLANVNTYSAQSKLLVESTLDSLNARVIGILASQKIKAFSEMLEIQNRELEMQKTELSKQSATLQNQNTELEIQKKQLDEANKLKTIFLSNMSHELRTPLNSVIALTGVLNRRLIHKIPEEEYSYLDVIERNGKHLLSLINDILDLSRIEAGREEMEVVQFNAVQLIKEVVDLIAPQAKEKDIDLILKTGGSDLVVQSDLKKCRHILQNIVGNAVKFTEKGKVEISAKMKEATLYIEVTDTGIGISDNQLEHIFDEFRQADNSTSRRFGGTGLGLSIAKKYTELLGGTITVKSSLGEGSVFTLKIPIKIAEETAETVEVQRSVNDPILKHKTETDGKTILLVEDSEPAIIQLNDVLKEGGYRVQLARNGLEALEQIGLSIPDAMILDLMMPGMDGFEVLKTLREEDRTANVPVLILTAKHITKEELQFLKRNNIHQLVQKGDINRNDLLKAIEEMAFKVVMPLPAPISNLSSKPVILVVEDNSDNMLTAKALLSDNYLVLEAINSKEALMMTRLHLPNLILMDIELPDIDGIQTFKKIRNDVLLQKIPIIALTASAMTTEREAILAHGFDGYIAKPIDEAVFTETIKQLLYG